MKNLKTYSIKFYKILKAIKKFEGPAMYIQILKNKVF